MNTLKSYAKVNLGLWVIGKRPDGYHDIVSYVHKVSLYDTITIKPYIKLRVRTSNPFIPENEGNIVYKAVRAFEDFTGLNADFDIFIQKRIPVGGGLGGGSSNAAVVLKYINEYFDNPISEKDLLKLASYVGADVPLFFKNGLVKISGKGEIIEETNEKYSEELIIIYPNIQVETASIYKKVSFDMLTNPNDLNIINSLLRDVKSLISASENTLGNIAKEEFPVIKEVENTLKILGYEPFITGSGSSVCALGTVDKNLENICKLKNWQLHKVRFL
ncbi:MAG TPA: 4-(cytidine 5'-diphospho)-2-C-methyl-D-erythritol kinase [Persephonella sp.]|nr:4-(cytidine 5'-diphospho)-2-C-methyl-D-erythritol kinase [Hydrogenothermaceae bacterium]HIQ24856.1 4-(cytidine 5'-diphospho)-2-C-methyl-D-erythritol kinase [Persephonella sp.]